MGISHEETQRDVAYVSCNREEGTDGEMHRKVEAGGSLPQTSGWISRG